MKTTTTTTTTTTTSAHSSRNLAAFRAHFTMTANKLAEAPQSDAELIERLIDKLVEIEENARAFVQAH